MSAIIDELERLYEVSFARFVGALRVVVGDPHVAEECVQEAFARAVASADTYRGGELGAWVWRIAVHGAVDARRRELKLAPIDAGAWNALAGTPAVDLPDASDRDLRAALLALSARRRLVVFLRYYGDLSQAEIAGVLGVEEGTIAATLSQARAHLRESLGQPRSEVRGE